MEFTEVRFLKSVKSAVFFFCPVDMNHWPGLVIHCVLHEKTYTSVLRKHIVDMAVDILGSSSSSQSRALTIDTRDKDSSTVISVSVELGSSLTNVY